MSPGVTTITELLDYLANGLAGKLTGAVLGLFTTAWAPASNTVYADLTEAAFTGYVQKVQTWNVPSINLSTFLAESTATTVSTWTGPAAGGGPTIFGWALMVPGAAGPPIVPPVVLSSGLLLAPVPLVDATASVGLVPLVNSNGTVIVNQVT